MRGNSYEALRDWDTRARSMFDCSTGAIESIEPLRRLTFRLVTNSSKVPATKPPFRRCMNHCRKVQRTLGPLHLTWV